jgi:hypothetical protein
MNRLIPLIFALVLLVPPELPAAEAPNDVRVLIDTSGSMKNSDPRNLRVPALKLLVNLFPEGSRGGVWLFDTQTRELVPAGAIDQAWKAKALKAAEQINSRGQFTNIEEALTAANRDWEPRGAGPGRRHMVLLTDGMVDVSRNADASRASRERLIAELIPKLQQEGVKVHTIALSDQADQELMRQLAMATEGWNETAQDAEHLQRSFVQMFNQTTPHDSVPLKDNRFSVDAGIEEFTVLVLLPPGAKPTQLIAPDHTEISQAAPALGARWVHDAGYDLVTVPKPPAGSWTLEAEIDPANQVLVVTNLKMVPTPVPSFVTVDEKPGLSVHFTENGEPVEREDFLGLITVKAALGQAAGHSLEAALQRSADRARFSHRFEEALAPGEYTLTVVADGKTFQREYSQTFRAIEAPIKVTTENLAEGETPHVLITLTPDPAVLVPDSLSVAAKVAYGGETVAGEAVRQGETWQLAVKPPPSGGRVIVNLTATAKTHEGGDLKLELKPVVIEAPHTHAAEAAPPPAPAHPAEAAVHPHAGPDWVMTLGIAAAVNLAVGLSGYLVYRMLRKRSQAAIDDLLGKLSP